MRGCLEGIGELPDDNLRVQLEADVGALLCGKLVSTGRVFLFRKESFPVCLGRGEVL